MDLAIYLFFFDRQGGRVTREITLSIGHVIVVDIFIFPFKTEENTI